MNAYITALKRITRSKYWDYKEKTKYVNKLFKAEKELEEILKNDED